MVRTALNRFGRKITGVGKARIKATTASLYTVIDGQAKLGLIGTSAHHISKMAGIATIDNKFAAAKTEFITSATEAVAFNAHRKVEAVKKQYRN
ncbi:hypothetical protein [Pedobacter sp. MR2016-24]|uniref:hypothetical protein n=1 Tax=Pedobacter sp. MR2016-24 TaxID=2994466 RepID=UPI002245A005|nr:hypothetical protein [Pedobacter sp. MR2016-24]MCX2483173.1 hypothetical protein [Pedobacter sp. MR2016-24]